MTPAKKISWAEANQSYLLMEFLELRRRLGEPGENSLSQPIKDIRETLTPPPAIDQLARTFELSSFERNILLLCAGIELDSTLAALCAEALGRDQRGSITFSLALGILPEPHWSALAPTGPLRRYHLVEIEPGRGLTSAALRIDERILHYLAGLNLLDPRLEPLLQLRHLPSWIAEEHRALARSIPAFDSPAEIGFARRPVLHLCGDDARGQEEIAALLAQDARRQLYLLRAEDAPASAAEIDQFVALWTREAALLPAALLIQCGVSTPPAAVRQLLERLPAPLVLASRDPVHLERLSLRYEVNKPEPAAQKRLWRRALGPAAESLNGLLDNLSEQFRLSAETISALGSAAVAGDGRADPDVLWKVCRALARPRLEDLAERIHPMATWDDLVLADAQKQILRQLAAQARYRMTVYESWGFAEKGRRGLGISALFSGASGTGKTLAAEVLARELELDLYRIDLSGVVSKYIGETEKNLKQVFDAAEEGGVLLLFDEADALFGKRSEVKDSHDRYANIEVGYLLQRMENFQGLAILTTNLKSSLDKSFQRRLRFTVDFPFPDAAQREAIWQRVFPSRTPLKNVNPKLLAQLNMTGGSIRNIALNSAFLAAEAHGAVAMEHLLQAARLEAIKIERPLSDTETRGWV
jgi:hypothetical protein